MRVTQLSAHNFLGFTSFKVSKLGKFTRISGAVGVGKTSVTDIIREAVKSSGVDPDLINIHTNSDRAEIMIEIDDKILVNRTITPTENKVKVTVDGQPMNKPQAFLNSLLGPFNLNPVDFFLANEREQRKILLSAVPFTLTREQVVEILGEDHPLLPKSIKADVHGLEALANMQVQVYERRAEENSDLTRMKKSIEQDKQDLPEHLDAAKVKAFNLTAKMKEVADARELISKHRADEKLLDELRSRASSLVAQKKSKQDAIAALYAEIERLDTEIDGIRTKGIALNEEVEKFVAPDISSVEAEIADFEKNQRLLVKLEDIERRKIQLSEIVQVHESLDILYKRLTTEVPLAITAKMKLPIEGLDLTNDPIRLNGISIGKLSTGQKAKFCVRLAKVFSGDLKTILLDRFESLNPAEQVEFIEELKDDDYHYLMTCTTDGPLQVTNVEVNSTPEPQKKSTGKAGKVEAQAGIGF